MDEYGYCIVGDFHQNSNSLYRFEWYPNRCEFCTSMFLLFLCIGCTDHLVVLWKNFCGGGKLLESMVDILFKTVN